MSGLKPGPIPEARVKATAAAAANAATTATADAGILRAAQNDKAKSGFPSGMTNKVLSGAAAHVGEHGVGGGEEFSVGDVVDDFGGSDAGGEDEGAAAAALFFVAGS
jgi:hypothetical protein